MNCFFKVSFLTALLDHEGNVWEGDVWEGDGWVEMDSVGVLRETLARNTIGV